VSGSDAGEKAQTRFTIIERNANLLGTARDGAVVTQASSRTPGGAQSILQPK